MNRYCKEDLYLSHRNEIETGSNRFGMLVNNSFQSDVRFIFEKEGVTLFAHRFLLITGSPVFCHMFSGVWLEDETVKITDTPSAVFKEIFQYLYTNELSNISESNAFDIMNGARKYEIYKLEEIVCEFLIGKLTSENVCLYYDNCVLFDNALTWACERFIERNTRLCLKSVSFHSANIFTLKRILSLDRVQVEEHELFEAMLRWADATCLELGLARSRSNKRSVLKGAEILIRFPTMTAQMFGQCLRVNGALEFFSKDEIAEMYVQLVAPQNVSFNYSNLPYNRVKRIKTDEHSITSMVEQQYDVDCACQSSNCYERLRIKLSDMSILYSVDLKKKLKKKLMITKDETPTPIHSCNTNDNTCIEIGDNGIGVILDAHIWHDIKLVCEHNSSYHPKYVIHSRTRIQETKVNKSQCLFDWSWSWSPSVFSMISKLDFVTM